jgi:uncharacterized cupin superfamily protein
MPVQTHKLIHKSLEYPDEVRRFNNGELRLVDLEGAAVALVRLQPGWRWSNDVKPLAGTDSCRVAHLQYVISGRLVIAMDDGAQLELSPGDAAAIPPGHDAWVVGDEPFVAVDMEGMKDYAR